MGRQPQPLSAIDSLEPYYAFALERLNEQPNNSPDKRPRRPSRFLRNTLQSGQVIVQQNPSAHQLVRILLPASVFHYYRANSSAAVKTAQQS